VLVCIQGSKVANVIFAPEFIRDLAQARQPNFAKLVLAHLFEPSGEFREDRNDHPYEGIAKGWIRWVSMSGAAIRVIYIEDGGRVYLYRAVVKADEGGLTAPAAQSEAASLASLPADILDGIVTSEAGVASRILTNSTPTLIRDELRKMYHVPHREIVLVSPELSPSLVLPTEEIGRFLYRAIEDGAAVFFVTQVPTAHSLKEYEDLASRSVQVHFVQNLRARLMLFDVIEYATRGVKTPLQPTTIMGSACITHHALGLGCVGANDELCFKFPGSHFAAFRKYADALLNRSIDLEELRKRRIIAGVSA
jgi:hypothetical protein